MPRQTWKRFDLPIPPMPLAYPEQMAITTNIVGTIIDDRIRNYSKTNYQKRTLIIKNHPAAPTDHTITYALLTHYPNIYVNAIPQLLKTPSHDYAVAYTKDNKPPTLTGDYYPAWIYLHFPEDALIDFQNIYNILDDHTWDGWKQTPIARYRIFYHKRIGYRITAPRPHTIKARILHADWYFKTLELFRKYDYQPIWFYYADPDRWYWIHETIRKHPYARPTKGGIWYVSNRPEDPPTPQDLEKAYRRLLHYPKPPAPKEPPIITAETRPRTYAIDPDDPDTPDELKPRERAIKTQSPFHLPNFTDDAWEKKHDDYVNKYGYAIRIPNWDDIIHLKLPPKTTKEDYIEYKEARKQGRPPRLPPEVIEYFDKRRQRYTSYLATPQPRWYRSYASILTALDDAQDALSSAVLLSQLAIRAAPRALSKLTRPTAYLMTLTDLINLANAGMRAPWTPKRFKRRLHDMIRENPFATMTQLKDPGALADKINWLPRTLELLQVTDSLFGIGLCLGPIFGLAADIAFGGIRALSGEPVSIYLPGKDDPLITFNAARNLKTAHAAAITNPILTPEDRTMLNLSICISANVLRPKLAQARKDPTITSTRDLLITAPRPTKPDTIDILQEAGLDPDRHSNLPLIDVKEALYDEWAQDIHARITTSNDLFLAQPPDGDTGYFNAVLTYHASLSLLASIARPGSILIRTRPDISLLMRILDAGYRPNPEIPEKDFTRALQAALMKAYNRLNPPHTRDIITPAWLPDGLLTSRQDVTYPKATALTKDQIAYIESLAQKDRQTTT